MEHSQSHNCSKRRKKRVRPRVPMLVLNKVNQRGSIDFVSDQLANGCRFRVLNVVGDYTREYALQVVDSPSPVNAWHANWTS